MGKYLTKDEVILLARLRAFKYFEKVDKWENDNKSLIKFVLRGFKFSEFPES